LVRHFGQYDHAFLVDSCSACWRRVARWLDLRTAG
jgi:hypothetical protein